MTTLPREHVHPNRQVWASRKWMWRSNEYCWHHHQSSSSENGSQPMVGERSGEVGVTYRRNCRLRNRRHSHRRSKRLQMQRWACARRWVLLLVAGRIITWCELSDHMQRGTCASKSPSLGFSKMDVALESILLSQHQSDENGFWHIILRVLAHLPVLAH
jgi:hypothetical protein